MRADLRRTHRRIWPPLAVLLVAGFVLGLALKSERPVLQGSVAGETRP
ncbi:hypothetical protein GCM10017083_42120 [Thalassobaculum fulvum]|uniref:Uncharacterized protein n=1 Tax=Thalassobaculum fulvum TaxID=1633335 RepID=A0A918XVA4_9PROT|nr:hypothetical protein [Thalassobaculum fulvum]GHD58726.1 hypothetical protein GCM10017083_42120 [Thalassobaculum fulvum]